MIHIYTHISPLPPEPPSPSPPHPNRTLTADVEQVREEEGLRVEVFDGQDDGSIQAAPQGLLGTAFVRDK